jgi:translocation protein SEC63
MAGIGSYFNRFNIVLLVLWAVVIGLGVYISTIQLEVEPFNPFTILGLEETATEQEVKKAYKRMVIVHHPDKVKDPVLKKEAETFFSEKLSKAYQALTDEVSKENWIKYGHPDGPQVLPPPAVIPEFINPVSVS